MSVCVPMCGPSGCCQADHGSCYELAQLSVSTYMPLFSKEGERKEEKERREMGVGAGGLQQRWSERIPRRAQNMSAGGTASPARFTDFQLLKTRLSFFPPLHLRPSAMNFYNTHFLNSDRRGLFKYRKYLGFFNLLFVKQNIRN